MFIFADCIRRLFWSKDVHIWWKRELDDVQKVDHTRCCNFRELISDINAVSFIELSEDIIAKLKKLLRWCLVERNLHKQTEKRRVFATAQTCCTCIFNNTGENLTRVRVLLNGAAFSLSTMSCISDMGYRFLLAQPTVNVHTICAGRRYHYLARYQCLEIISNRAKNTQWSVLGDFYKTEYKLSRGPKLQAHLHEGSSRYQSASYRGVRVHFQRRVVTGRLMKQQGKCTQ